MARFRKEYYFSEDSYKIPFEKLNSKTRANLGIIRDFYGIDWDDEASVTPVPGSGSVPASQAEIDEHIAQVRTGKEAYDHWMKIRNSEDYKYLGDVEPDPPVLEEFEKDYKDTVRYLRTSLKRGRQPIKSFIVEGVGPDGQEVVYVRRETGGSIGPTNLYMDGERFQVSKMVTAAKVSKWNKENPTAQVTPQRYGERYDPFSPKEELDWN